MNRPFNGPELKEHQSGPLSGRLLILGHLWGEKMKAVIIAISSDIGYALAKRWQKQGMKIAGTYRKPSALVHDLKKSGIKTFSCDLSQRASVDKACVGLRRALGRWDYLILCAGDLQPVGAFADGDFNRWKKSVEVNFLSQLRFVHQLLPWREKKARRRPVVVFFAGSGTNKATKNYSAYTVSKIALIKMCELLDAEVPDVNFVILGPGWVKTKIHQATLDEGKSAGANYQKTLDKLAGHGCTPMEAVLDCCDWLIRARRRAVGGRNFSAVFDKWGSPSLVKKLLEEPDMYKLRRHGNDWKS
jgi:NAD(P)-dependent dehydrogenase (short-subunit alcohol dehydrogenase family)